MQFKNTTCREQAPFIWTSLDAKSFWYAVFLFFFTSTVLILNQKIWHYPPVNYFTPGIDILFFFLALCTLGLLLTQGTKSRLTAFFAYLTTYHTILLLVLYFTLAIQLTPFQPIDKTLLKMDLALHYPAAKILDFLWHHESIKSTLEYIYNFIGVELFFLPIYLIAFGHYYRMKQFFYFLLSTLSLGYVFYYFFPTMAPASVIASPYFSLDQFNTGLKFEQIHHHFQATSDLGGMISMPSFHILWALICQISTKDTKFLWYLLWPITIGIMVSCVVLGWHYLVDLFGSLIALAIAQYLTNPKAYQFELKSLQFIFRRNLN